MSVMFDVYMEQKDVSEDDGDSVWCATTLSFGCRGIWIGGEVLVDGYSRRKIVTIRRDDFGVGTRLAELLALSIYQSWCGHMNEFNLDTGTAYGDVESLINCDFYHSDARALLQKINTAIVKTRHKKLSEVSTV
jgi:hypothetical protein